MKGHHSYLLINICWCNDLSYVSQDHLKKAKMAHLKKFTFDFSSKSGRLQDQ